jgi:phosphoribosyl 1,2-cyclic phosphodiesterase
MSLRFGSLGSGSEGNALIVEVKSIVGTTRIMMDCGFGLAETERRLARLGLLPSDLDGIAVTHEHSDHIGGVARFARKHRIPVWLTHGTAKVLRDGSVPTALLHYVDPHQSFAIGDIHVTPYYVPHDANEPVQYVFSDGDKRLGVLTDTGTLTTHIEETLSGCNALVLECNHDLDMLMNGPYPACSSVAWRADLGTWITRPRHSYSRASTVQNLPIYLPRICHRVIICPRWHAWRWRVR